MPCRDSGIGKTFRVLVVQQAGRINHPVKPSSLDGFNLLGLQGLILICGKNAQGVAHIPEDTFHTRNNDWVNHVLYGGNKHGHGIGPAFNKGTGNRVRGEIEGINDTMDAGAGIRGNPRFVIDDHGNRGRGDLCDLGNFLDGDSFVFQSFHEVAGNGLWFESGRCVFKTFL